MARTASAQLGPGSRLADRYQIREQIGSGGMGAVYRAHDELMGREVAVKVLFETPAGDTTFEGDWAREARAAAHLSHPGIAAIFDAGAEDGFGFIVMELVEGKTLRQVLTERGCLGALEAAEIAAAVADALDHAHRHGVVHCDIKPQNIILTPSGAPKVIDFGIARAASATRTQLSDAIVGSAPYLSPEQARGERLDRRTDVYALGVVLYEMLAGRPPFEGASVAAVVAQRLVADPPPPRTRNPAVPRSLERVVLTALARDPARRYATAGELRVALRNVAVAERAAAQARTTRLGAVTAAVGRSAPASTPVRRLLARQSRARLAAVGVALLLGPLLVSRLAGGSGIAKGAAPNVMGEQTAEAPTPLEVKAPGPATPQPTKPPPTRTVVPTRERAEEEDEEDESRPGDEREKRDKKPKAGKPSGR